MRKIIALLLVTSIMLTGCWDQKVFEKIGFILQIGIESGKTKKLLTTYTSPVVGGEIEEQVEIVKVESDLLRAAREYARMHSPKSLEGGKVQQLLFSDELAKKGINEMLDLFHRDPTLPTLALIAVIEGSPYEMLKKATTFEDKPRAAFYINELLEGNIKSSYLPETRVWDFSMRCFSPGIDPIAPMLKLQEEGIVVIGSAVFSEDKMVGKINTKDTALLLAMMGKLKATEYISTNLKIQGEEGLKKTSAAFLLVKTKNKITVKIVEDKPIVNIDMKMESGIDEFQWNNIADIKNQEEMEQQLSSEIRSECIKIIDYLKSTGSDPLGIGDIVRAKHNDYWQEANWKDAYKDAEVDVSVELDIKHFGALN